MSTIRLCALSGYMRLYSVCMRRGVNPKSKRSVGRPSSYRREYCDRIIEAMASGLSAEAGAARIGISARSLFYWQQQHPEFLQAIQEGRQRSQLWWEKRAIAMAKGVAGNTQIVMLGLRNRSRAATGWNNDSMKLEHSGPEGGPVQVEPTTVIDVQFLTREQRDQFRSILLAAKAHAEKDKPD
jgi:hypothetical protein